VTGNRDIELTLRDWLEAEAIAVPPARLLPSVLESTATVRQQPTWLPWPEVPPMASGLRLVVVLAVMALVLAALSATVLIGGPSAVPQFENGRIAYVQGMPPGDQQDIFVANGDGTGAVPLTQAAVYEDYPTWSPDGSLIAFVRELTPDQPPSAGCTDAPEICERGTAGTTGLFVIRPDGSGERLLVGPLSSPIFGLAWSPDGTQLSFVGPLGVAAVNIDGTDLRLLFDDDNVEAALWSPDGGSVVLHGWEDADHADLYVVDVTTGFARQLTSDVGWEHHPRWSPDGQRIVFSSDPDGSGERAKIEVMGADGEGRRVVNDFGVLPDWSPDGQLLVFEGWVEPGVWVVRPDGSGLRRLTDGGNPRFSPDGQLVVAWDGVGWWAVSLDGTNRHPLDTGNSATGMASSWDWEGVPR